MPELKSNLEYEPKDFSQMKEGIQMQNGSAFGEELMIYFDSDKIDIDGTSKDYDSINNPQDEEDIDEGPF